MKNGPLTRRSGGSRKGSPKLEAESVGSSRDHWSVTAREPGWGFESAGPHLAQYSAPAVADEGGAETAELPPPSPRRRSTSWLPEHLRGDYGSVALLLFLYLLQGIPLGLTASIPLVLQARHVTYAQQAVFSLAYWPFSLKLFWAPIVDSCYSSRVGRRKSWLVPTQYLIGAFMLVLSYYIGDILGGGGDGASTNVYLLALIFFPLNFLAATQDIAVDGWALTMLSRRNVGYASTCNAVGQTAGFFLGNVVFLALESADFCNAYLRSTPQPEGLVDLAGFVYFWAFVFLVTTTLVLVFKREVDHTEERGGDDIDRMGVVNAYKLLLDIVRLKPVFSFIIILVTAKIAFAATDGITGLKLIDMGVPKAKLALVAVPLTPVQILLPWAIGRFTSGPRPLNVFLKAYPYRLFMGLIFALVVFWTPSWQLPDGDFPFAYFAIIVCVYCIHQVTTNSIFVALMAFHAQISDPVVGGTYMTLLNTMCNFGGNWPVTAALSFVDDLTSASCIAPDRTPLGPCGGKALDDGCRSAGGVCETWVDGYYVMVAMCTLVGLVWWRLTRRTIDRLQDVEKRQWSCSHRPKYARLRNY